MHSRYRAVIFSSHYIDVIMITMASQITSLTVVYSTVYSDADQRKHQSSTSLAFVWGIHRDRWSPRTKGQLRGKWRHNENSQQAPQRGGHGRVITSHISRAMWLFIRVLTSTTIRVLVYIFKAIYTAVYEKYVDIGNRIFREIPLI